MVSADWVNSMIIDFEKYKREHAPEPMQSPQELEALQELNSAFGTFLSAFSTNSMMMDITASPRHLTAADYFVNQTS